MFISLTQFLLCNSTLGRGHYYRSNSDDSNIRLDVMTLLKTNIWNKRLRETERERQTDRDRERNREETSIALREDRV